MKILGLVLLAVLAWRFVDFGEFARSLSVLGPWAVVGLLAVSIVDRFLMAGKWAHLGRAMGLPVPFSEYAASYWAASFLGYFLPTTLGGEIYRGYRVSRVAGRNSDVLATMILEKLLGILATILFAWAGLAYLLFAGLTPAAREIFLVLLVVTGVAMALFVASFVPVTHEWALSLFERIGGGGPIRKISAAYTSFRGRPGAVVANLGLAIVENAVQLALTWGAAVALDIGVDPLIFLAIVAVTQFLRRITMIFDGWGLSEALRLVTYGLIGVSGSDTLAIALVGHATMALASVPGALVFFRDPHRNRITPRTADSADAPPEGLGSDLEGGSPLLPFEKPGKLTQIVQRFLMPPIFVTIYYLVRDRATVSFRAEVEVSRNLRFGRGCTVSSFVKIKATNGPVRVGTRSGFATGCFVSAGDRGIEIGSNVLFGPNVTVLGSTYRYDDLDVPLEDQGVTSKGVRIGNNVWIGAGSVIADGAVIGDNTIVVANSLVTRRFPPNVIIQGSPARILMRRGRQSSNPPKEESCESESSESSEAPSTI